jgi:hypothetical protein
MAEDIKINRGDVAEGILGATLTAKFVKVDPISIANNDKLTHADIDAVLDKYNRSSAAAATGISLKTKASKAGQTDNIIFKLNLTKSSLDLLSQPASKRAIVHDLYDSAIDYVEKTWTNEILGLINNGKVDNVVINSDGLGDQKGTKADIKISVNGIPYQRQISLKVKGGEQFAQITGTDFEKQKALWQDTLSLNIENLSEVYYQALSGFDKTKSFSSREDQQVTEFKNIIKQATAVTYKAAAAQMQKLNQSGNTAFFENIAKFILSGAAGKTGENIELVKLEKSTYKQLKFDQNFVKTYSEKLKKEKLLISFRPYGDPVVQVHVGAQSGTNLLFQVRVKIAAESSMTKAGKIYRPYARHIIEAGPKMFSI